MESPSMNGVRACHKWLSYCLSIGWPRWILVLRVKHNDPRPIPRFEAGIGNLRESLAQGQLFT